MPILSDIYALSETRTSEEVQRFLDQFLPTSIQLADEYEIPQFSDEPHTVVHSASELVDYCCENLEEVHAIYWRCDLVPLHAHVFFLADRHLIFGISSPEHDVQTVEAISKKMKQFVGTSNVLIFCESPPPDSSDEFLKLV